MKQRKLVLTAGDLGILGKNINFLIMRAMAYGKTKVPGDEYAQNNWTGEGWWEESGSALCKDEVKSKLEHA